MRTLTHSAPRLATGALLAATIVSLCTLAVPAAAQQHDDPLALSAPRFGRDPGTLHVAPPHVELTPVARPNAAPTSLGVRVLAEAGVELLTLGATIAAPALIAGLSARNCSGELFCIGPDVWATFFGVIGGALGQALFPPILEAVANALGGHGDVGAAYLGTLIADAAAGFAVAGGVASNDTGVLGGMLVLAGALVLAGPIVGYELSIASTTSHTRPAVTPTIAVARDGATFGVGGAFE